MNPSCENFLSLAALGLLTRMRPTEFFRRLPELEKQYLAATQEERDGKAVWQLEALSLFGKKSPDLSKESRAA